MPRHSRLDAELVRRGLASSRQQAADLVDAGRVRAAGVTRTAAASRVDPGTPLVVVPPTSAYASRGGQKLAGALDRLPALTVTGRRCLDAGASTGGFTDVLLRRGAAHVTAVDVGYGQLVWRLRADPRVTTLDRTNARFLQPDALLGPVDLVLADLSFISLRLVLPALRRCAEPAADFLLLVKPQFEGGRGQTSQGGVVRDPRTRLAAVESVVGAAATSGLGLAGATESPLPGVAGNVEYFLWLHADAPAAVPAALRRLVSVG